MKKLILGAFVTLMFISTAVNAQWEALDSGYESPWILFDNSFPAGQSTIGYVGGMRTTYNGYGVILKTDDAGATWTTILGGTDGSLNGIEGIFFTSTDIGYAAGWNDDALFTDDGGDTWSDMTVGTGVWYYTDIEFWDADNGVISAQLNAGGSQVWVTDDAGETWTAASGVSIGIIDMAYADANTLFAVGTEEDIIESTDGGLTWSLNNDGTDPDNDPLLGVHFYNSSFGVVGGMDGVVKITTNGGSSWTEQQIGGSYPSLYAVYCEDTETINMGGTDGNIYKSTDGGDSWSSVSSEGTSTLYQFAFTSNGSGYVSGASGNLLTQLAPFGADFSADETTICVGETVNFTDNSSQAIGWDWTFDGGTPATSTDQNPSVVYNTPGVYDVELTVTDGTDYDTETKYAYITVNDTPSQADAPDGDDEICTNNFFTYTTNEVDYAESYEWELSPDDAGTLTWTNNEAQIETTDWTGDFTLEVRALNGCGDGEWSDEFEGTIVVSPDEFEVLGGGSYCDGDDGMEISLDGSQIDIDYELYLDSEPTGTIVAGTGSEISFGLQTDEGYYTVEASNGTCETIMTGQVEITIMYTPLEPSALEGPDAVCSSDTSDYTTEGSDGAESYMWALSPEEAGTLESDGTNATVYWNSGFSGTATISVYGINDCGEGNPTEFEVSVESMPSPEIEGEALVCDNHFEDYTVTENDGSAYTWEVTGGTITDGQGTYLITVEWGEPGTGTVNVSEETTNGCEGISDEFEVMIDDCTGINDNAILDDVLVYPNPSTTNVNISMTVNSGVRYTTKIYNTVGQVVYSSEAIGTGSKQTVNVNVNSFPVGLYILHITSDNALLWQGKLERSR